MGLRVSSDRGHTLTQPTDDDFELRRSATGSIVDRYRSTARYSYAVASPSLKHVVVVEHDGESVYQGRVWHPFEGEVLDAFTLPRPEGWLAVSSDGLHLAVITDAGVEILRLPTGTRIAAVELPDDRVTAVAFGPGGTLALGTGRGGIARVVLDR